MGTMLLIPNARCVNKRQKAGTRVSCFKRFLLISIGFFFLILGIIGVLLPVMPTIPFFIIASICFSGSSNRLHNMLINNRWIGRHLKNFQEHKGLGLREKVFIILFQWIALGVTTIFLVRIILIKILMIIMALGVTIYILSLKTTKE